MYEANRRRCSFCFFINYRMYLFESSITRIAVDRQKFKSRRDLLVKVICERVVITPGKTVRLCRLVMG